MVQFVAFEDGVEVNGQTVRAIIAGMGMLEEHAKEILAQCGIHDPQPGEWYSQQKWLDAFRIIANEVGPASLRVIGRAIPENADFPPEIDSIGKALTSIDIAYHMNHRNGEIGAYDVKALGENSAEIVCCNPYPCTFDYGIIEAMAKRFKPTTSRNVIIIHDDNALCREKGDDSCTYHVSW